MSEAIKPTFNIPVLKTVKEAEKKGVTPEESAYYSMSTSKGWKQFMELASTVKEELDDVNTKAIAKGSSFEEIGRNTLVISLTKDIINRLLNMVGDSREAVEDGGTK